MFVCLLQVFLSQLIQRDDTVHITFDIIYMNKRSPVLDILKQGQILLNSWIFLFHFQQIAEGKQEEIQQKGQAEKKELQHKIDEMEEKEQELQAKIEALQADNDFTNERLTALQGKLANPEIDLI